MRFNVLRNLGLATLALALSTQAMAQRQDLVAAWFDEDITERRYDNLPDLAQLVLENTRLSAAVRESEDFILVAGVLDMRSGKILYGALSQPMTAVAGQESLQLAGKGRLRSPWQGFEDPLFGFEDPLFGKVAPPSGFEDPLFGFEDPLFGILGGPLEAVWGTDGVLFNPGATRAYRRGVGGKGAATPEQVLEAVWGSDGASYEGPADSLLIVAPLSLDPETRVSFSAATLPLSARHP